MSKLFSIAALFILCATHSIAAESYTAQWQKGTSFYSQKDYDSAAYYFEQIAALQPHNADVYYNLGNAYYRLNKVAPAVLNYERALLINPDFTLAKENLLLAQNRINNAILPERDIFFMRWWHSATKATHANTFAVISLALFILFILLLLSNRLKKDTSRRLPPQVSGIIFFVFLCFITLALISGFNAVNHNSYVVMQADVPLMNSDLRGKPLVLVPEGTTVRIIKEDKGEWAEVSLPDGRSGWIQVSTLNKI